MTNKQEYVYMRDGKEVVNYKGLLALAHEEGLARIATTLIQIPSEDNGGVAIVHAEVETSKGHFEGIGDASPQNVNRMIAGAIIRMAETRGKARALRDAVNIGVTSIEELGDWGDTDDGREVNKSSGEVRDKQDGQRYSGDAPKASPYKPASANQLATITRLSRLLGAPEEPGEDMTSADASERITELSREYNQRKATPEGARRRQA